MNIKKIASLVVVACAVFAAGNSWGAADESIQLDIRNDDTGESFVYLTTETETIGNLRRELAGYLRIPFDDLVIHATGRLLENADNVNQSTVQEEGLEHSIISIMSRFAHLIIVNDDTGEELNFPRIELTETIDNLKERVSNLWGIPRENLRFRARGIFLENDDRTIQEEGLSNERIRVSSTRAQN